MNMTLDGTSKTGINGPMQHDFLMELDRFIFFPFESERLFLLGIAALAYEDGRE